MAIQEVLEGESLNLVKPNIKQNLLDELSDHVQRFKIGRKEEYTAFGCVAVQRHSQPVGPTHFIAYLLQ